MNRLVTLGSVLGLLMTMAPAYGAPVSSTASPMCQATSSTPDLKETRRVLAMLVVGDTVYIGGRFNRVTSPNGGTTVERNHLAACSLSTGAILPWNPNAAGAEPLKGSVYALQHDGSRIIAGGAFDTVGGVAAAGLVALDANPNTPSPTPLLWGGNPGPGTFHKAEVKALAFSEDRKTLYMGGTFVSAGPVGGLDPHIGVAKIDAATGAIADWAPALISESEVHDCPPIEEDPTCVEPAPREIEIRAIVVRGNRVVVGGFFTEQALKDGLGTDYDGEGHLAAFDSVTAASLHWDFKPNYPVHSLAADADNVFVGGAGVGVSKNTLTAARWSDGEEQWTMYADGNWQAVWHQDGVVYGGGHMRRCGTKNDVRETDEPAYERMCAFDAGTGAQLDWFPIIEHTGTLGTFTLHGAGNALVAGGEFTKVNGVDQLGTTRFGSVGGGPLPPGPGGPNGPANPTTSGSGYWMVATDGGIFSYGAGQFFGSTGNIRLAQPIVGMAATPSKQGYWLVASDGGIFAYGDAQFYGSTGNIKLAKPIVGMTTTPTGRGYWLVASDGGIFAFGDAEFFGSTGNIKLAKPITAMTATRTGSGYWMTATDGGIFAFGDAVFHGSTGGRTLAKPIVAMTATPSGGGYLLAGADGAVFPFGDAVKLGDDLAGTPLAKPIVGMTGF
ncbi:MAG: hypothetical protein ACRDJO_05600 [Actinomycetota bacterium]